MKTYKLIVMYPSSNRWQTAQDREVTVKADRFYTNDGSYYFVDKGGGTIICCYPIQYTIIDNIVR